MALGACPDVSAASLFGLDDARMRFDISLMNSLRRKGTFHNDVGFLEAEFNLAFMPRQIHKDIARHIDGME